MLAVAKKEGAVKLCTPELELLRCSVVDWPDFKWIVAGVNLKLESEFYPSRLCHYRISDSQATDNGKLKCSE